MKLIIAAIALVLAVAAAFEQAPCSTLHITAAVFCRCDADPSLSCVNRFPSSTHPTLRKMCTQRTVNDEHIEKALDCAHILPTNIRAAYEDVIASSEWGTRRNGRYWRPYPSNYYRAVVKEADGVDQEAVRRSRLVRYNDIRA